MGASEKAYDLEQRFNSHVYQHRYTLVASGSPSLGSSFVTATGLSAVLDAGASYQFHAIVGANFSSSGGTLTFRVHPTGGLAATNFRVFITELDGTAVGSTGSNGALDGVITGSAIGAGLADRFITWDGYLDVSVAGTMSIQVALSSGAGSYYRYGTALDIIQVA